MRICVIPIDNRPVCYSLFKDITDIDGDIELFLPPRELLGNLTKYAETKKIVDWIKEIPKVDCIIASLDTLAYGGLIPSRRITDSYDTVKQRLESLKSVFKDNKVFAFSSIMRISNNNYNEEEKDYWKDYGKKIFEYSFYLDKNGVPPQNDIPDEILSDYTETRKRNFEINKLYLEWQKEGVFDTLIFSKDDCAEFGFNVAEAKELEKLGGKTKTGADEIPLTLLARAIEKEIKVFPKFLEPEHKNKISNYEDVSIEKSVLGQLELGGFRVVGTESEADLVLIINNFKEKQGELVMGWETEPFGREFTAPAKPFAVADVRFANGADNTFAEQVLKLADSEKFYGYSAWNTSANTLGSLFAEVKVKWNAKEYSDSAFKKFLVIRFLDDWAYQANIRGQITKPRDIKHLMKPFEDKVFECLNIPKHNIKYFYPWNRKFEIEVVTD